MPQTHTVDQPAELLPFLFARHPEVKRTKVRQWLKFGVIHVNGHSVTLARHALQRGDSVSVRAPQESRAARQLPRGLSLLFEDEALLVIEKPVNLLSIASAAERSKTAYAALTNYVRRGNPRSPSRVWIVHRLDRETSGLMVFAKSEAAKRSLQENWHTAEKRYLAIVEGNSLAEQGVLESHLDESNPYKVFSSAPSERTRLATTRYRVLKRNATLALLELTPVTGRRNQLRVHLADANCPIVGDSKYGAGADPARRLGLHAASLRFQHPSTGERVGFESPLPRELSRLV